VQSEQADTDPTVYELTYFNGVTEQVTGMGAVHLRIISPATRVPEARDVAEGATYRVVSS
jgi:hypothetical protein